MNFNAILLLIIVFLSSWCGLKLYIKLAHRLKLQAIPNFRSMHAQITPHSGGVVFGLIYIGSISYMVMFGLLDFKYLYVCIGSIFALLIGFIDDFKSLKAKYKLLAQIFLATYVEFIYDFHSIIDLPFINSYLNIFISIFCLVGILNMYNFIDGIDGMASFAAILICFSFVLYSVLAGVVSQLCFLGLLLMTVNFSFLFFNLSPAKLFMGDSGSLFLGYLFCIFILDSIISVNFPISIWFIIFSLYFIDTSGTILIRLFLFKFKIIPHRSNAYQNLARLTTHNTVIYLVLFYYIFLIIPLLFIAAYSNINHIYLIIISSLLPILFNIKYGPLLSRD
jgi:Fuc2NAc and GlcNAc transferase